MIDRRRPRSACNSIVFGCSGSARPRDIRSRRCHRDQDRAGGRRPRLLLGKRRQFPLLRTEPRVRTADPVRGLSAVRLRPWPARGRRRSSSHPYTPAWVGEPAPVTPRRAGSPPRCTDPAPAGELRVSVLYCAQFTVASQCTVADSIRICWAVDDFLGDDPSFGARTRAASTSMARTSARPSAAPAPIPSTVRSRTTSRSTPAPTVSRSIREMPVVGSAASF